MPSAATCLQKLSEVWISWAGYPKHLVCDRGSHNKGDFGKGLASHGVRIRSAGVESHEQIGRVERHGGIFRNPP